MPYVEGVLLSPRACERFAGAAARLLREGQRYNGGGGVLPPDVAAELEDMLRVARRYREAVAARVAAERARETSAPRVSETSETVTGETDATVERMDTTQAAQLLGISPVYVRRLFSDGRIPAWRNGRRWVACADDVDAFARDRRARTR